MIKIAALRPGHVQFILSLNESAGIKSPMAAEDMIASYTSPGSLAVTMLAYEDPVACGGIINVGWNRGEAWVLTAHTSWQYRKTMFREMKRQLSFLAGLGGFRRVQATCFTPGRDKFFDLLGFKPETPNGLRGYGPAGETAFMYSRCYL